MLRPARASDLAALSALLQASGLPPYDLTSAHLRRFIVLETGGVLAGAVGLEGDGRAALLRSLVVAAPLRGQGWGQKLVARIEVEARQQGVRELYLLTTTAAPFFASLGYVEAAREQVPATISALPEFASICPASAACMKRVLDPVAVEIA